MIGKRFGLSDMWVQDEKRSQRAVLRIRAARHFLPLIHPLTHLHHTSN